MGPWEFVSCFVTIRGCFFCFSLAGPPWLRGEGRSHRPLWEPYKLASVTGARWPAKEGWIEFTFHTGLRISGIWSYSEKEKVRKGNQKKSTIQITLRALHCTSHFDRAHRRARYHHRGRHVPSPAPIGPPNADRIRSPTRHTATHPCGNAQPCGGWAFHRSPQSKEISVRYKHYPYTSFRTRTCPFFASCLPLATLESRRNARETKIHYGAIIASTIPFRCSCE